MADVKQLVYDLETTGVLTHKHGIHQFSGIILINGKVEEQFDFRMRPNPKAQIDEEALAVSNVTKEQILAYEMDMYGGYRELIKLNEKYCDRYKKWDKFHLVGYNNRNFDDQFLRGLFLQCGDEYFGSWYWADSIDVMILASDYLRYERHKMENFKLVTVAKYLGLTVDETQLHDAHYDLYLTLQIYEIVKRNKPQ